MKKKILIIDDDLDMCSLLSRFLNKKGFETEMAHNGAKGLAKFTEQHFDIVLCDFRLGDKDGKDVLLKIKEANPQTIVIIITGYSDIKTAVDVIKLGAFDYITKPLIPDEVINVIEKAMAAPSTESITPSVPAPAQKNKRSYTISANKEFLVGQDGETARVYKQIEIVACTNYSIILYGESGRMFGTVGPLINNVSVKIADDGEILCKGPNVMMGYYKRPDLTGEVMEDGWFKTGDIGILMEENFLKITDRKKEMFKTSGGKYVAPVAVENKLKESSYIENLIVTGADEKYVGALIIPAFDELKKWCRKNNIADAVNEELINLPQVKELYKNEVENFNKDFSHVEQIKKFELLPHEWSVETGEMTPKLSLKRKVIMEKYKDAVKRIYS